MLLLWGGVGVIILTKSEISVIHTNGIAVPSRLLSRSLHNVTKPRCYALYYM